MDDNELKELFEQLNAAGWEPMLCDTKIDVYENPVNCGYPEDIGEASREEGWYPHEMLPKHRIFKVPAKGDSMRDAGIEAGDMLTIETDMNIMDDDLVLVCVDGDFTVKAFYEDDNGEKWLVPFNDRFEPIRLCGESRVYISGKVIEISKRHPRVHHRDMTRIVNRAKEQSTKSRKMSRDELKALIAWIAPRVKYGRQWFAVYRPLVQRKQIEKGDYPGFCLLVEEAVPEHEHLPSAQEVQRMDTQSFTKSVSLWDELDAPVKGKRFLLYKQTAENVLGWINT